MPYSSHVNLLPKQVLAVGAHPDDVEILCAGTLARYAGSGCDVVICSATNGDRGSRTIEPADLAVIRQREGAEAADVIGARYVCCGLSDTNLDESGVESRTALVDLIRDVQPDVVLTHDPGDYHADHQATSRLVLEATFTASVTFVKTGHVPSDAIVPVIYMDTLAGIGFAPEQYVDITPTFDAKAAMLRRHVSQVEWMRDPNGVDLVEIMETMSRYRGIQCGVKYAEAFRPARGWLREGTRRLLP